ncbi:hypothetical protein SVIRM249S_06909 [Streptomyces viridochromogenes]
MGSRASASGRLLRLLGRRGRPRCRSCHPPRRPRLPPPGDALRGRPPPVAAVLDEALRRGRFPGRSWTGSPGTWPQAQGQPPPPGRPRCLRQASGRAPRTGRSSDAGVPPGPGRSGPRAEPQPRGLGSSRQRGRARPGRAAGPAALRAAWTSRPTTSPTAPPPSWRNRSTRPARNRRARRPTSQGVPRRRCTEPDRPRRGRWTATVPPLASRQLQTPTCCREALPNGGAGNGSCGRGTAGAAGVAYVGGGDRRAPGRPGPGRCRQRGDGLRPQGGPRPGLDLPPGPQRHATAGGTGARPGPRTAAPPAVRRR